MKRILDPVSRLVPLAGVAGAVVLGVALNVAAARRYHRFDATDSGRYTLSAATTETLRSLSSLPEKVEVWVILGPGDPVASAVRGILLAYAGETPNLAVHFLDPEREGGAVAELRSRFGLGAGKSEGGRAVRDAIAIAAYQGRHYMVAPDDIFVVTGQKDDPIKSRAERAFTTAIRAVLSGEKTTLCFTTGHRERAVDAGGNGGLASLRQILLTDNFDVVSLDAGVLHEAGSSGPEGDPLRRCGAIVVAGPEAPFEPGETERLRAYLLEGGSALIAAGPLVGDERSASSDAGRLVDVGLGRALRPFGIELRPDLVVEDDEALVVPREGGVGMFAEVRPHAVTGALLPGSGDARDAPRVPLYYASSLVHVADESGVAASDLLVSSAHSYGLVKHPRAGEPLAPVGPEDHPGPLTLAMASERPRGPRRGPLDGPHGPRLVVIGAQSALADRNWTEPGRRGLALFVENALGWITARPPVLDVPDHASRGAAFAVSEATRSEVRRYVCVFMPLASSLLGLAVYFWRKSTEGRGTAPPRPPRAPKAKRTKRHAGEPKTSGA